MDDFSLIFKRRRISRRFYKCNRFILTIGWSLWFDGNLRSLSNTHRPSRIPLEFWAAPTFESIGDALGETVEVDHDYGRVKVVVDGFKELCFETAVEFKGGEFHEGEEVIVSLKYEKLFGYYIICGNLCHDEEVCPSNPKAPEERSQEKQRKKEVRDGADGKHDDRARSYKGVVIHGNNEVQDKEREKRDYYGKGKGKMFDEVESRWMKVPDKGTKRNFGNNGYSGHKGHYRGAEEGSRYRSRRWESARVHSQEDRSRASTGGRMERSQRVVIREEEREDGEILAKQVDAQIEQNLASAAFQVELAKTQAEPTEVIKGQVETTKVTLPLVKFDDSLDLANEALENIELEEDLMVTEENIGNENMVENIE